MTFLHKVQRCNRRDLRRFVPFSVDGLQYGWLMPDRAAILLGHPKVFQPAAGGVALNPMLGTMKARSKAIAEITPELTATGLFAKPCGELYAARNTWGAEPAFKIDRALNPNFGLRAYGVHVNGIVQKRWQPYLWIGTRADTLLVEPGKLDNMVAGGQPADLGLMVNVVKECKEEAHITRSLARTAKPTGVLTYSFEAPEGLRCDTLFCYDLPMPTRVRPRPSDEIAGYELMPISKALRLVRSSDLFKFNVNLVIIDFAIRHGIITAENEPDFENLVAGLHERPPSIM
jgi:Domain of unknown function (DUF4743)